MRAVSPRGRWIWRVSGLVTMSALAVPAVLLITRAGAPVGGPPQPLMVAPTRTFTVPQPITSLYLESYGAPVVITGAPVSRAQVTETIMFSPPDDTPPAVTETVINGRLTLTDSACGEADCSVGFTVTVPRGIAVTASSDSGPVTVTGVAAANLDSGGGPVRVAGISRSLTVNSETGPIDVTGVADASLDSGGGPVGAANVRGPLTVSTENGPLVLDGLSGPLDADTGGGRLDALNVAAVTANVSTENGNASIGFTTAPEAVTVDTGGGVARLEFAAAPRTVNVTTEGGNAILTVPGGPYALTTESEGGPQLVQVPSSPTASRSISVNTGGGGLRIAPEDGSVPAITIPGGAGFAGKRIGPPKRPVPPGKA